MVRRTVQRLLSPVSCEDAGPYFYAYYGIIRLLSPRMAVPTPSDSVAASSLSETAATSTSTLLVAGGVAGIVGWASTYPLDSIKTRIQASDAQAFTTRSSAPSRPVSTLATIRTSLASSGNRRSLLAGLGPTLLRAVPVNMVRSKSQCISEADHIWVGHIWSL
ncbi:uncharacterized protein L969DRAFT_199276 [Mixia osmundae IAM 14324]|uniref:uncharacterized protein n=1 Tax=Mixia osmundae (strain CBS 9802 / IAM 14324 / JCM 22182 / KY 12970) TaxID=764103 RepID=UPI0004A54CD3|nr:uncharacterized protein L969DRAFT_199276 [Mixia osmundae IAM 14324]KEI37376.1 hypothetical protein L969DRAFT_199276 [Mixia osmundae IAM 14324]